MRQVSKLFLAALLALTILWVGTTTIQAADEETNTTSLATAPAGLNQLDKLFELPATFSNGLTNSASIQDATSTAAPYTQAIQLMSGKKQTGGFWSTDANRLNLNEDATIKAWVYLGSQTSASKAGDGMAFVMQNDANGVQAASKMTSKNMQTESLGVWGIDSDNKQQDASAFAASAIQNSWALEFDTYANTSSSWSNAGDADSFDVGIKTQHIATGYPGDPNQYVNKKVSSGIISGIVMPDRYFFTQTHNDPSVGLSLGDSNWHHLVLQWNASAKTMTYTFNDINADGSTNANAIQKTETIDTSKFNSSDGLMRWGFIGATTNSSTNMVVIESVPNAVKNSASVQVTDKTANKTVAAGDKVKAKHELQYDYKLNYDGGLIDWDNIEADLKLPKHVTFTSAVIKYANGAYQTIDAPAADATEVSYALKTALSASNQTATISLTGTADKVDVNSSTTTTTSTFKNKSFSTTADAPDYTITVAQDIDMYVSSTQTVANGNDLKFTGLVIAEGSEQISNSSITIHSNLNGEDLPTYNMSDDDESALFRVHIKAEQLHVGENKLILYASDFDDNQSEKQTVTITVTSGALSFKTVASESKFQNIVVDGHAKTAGRQDDWQLVVADDRGKGSSWKLTASAGKFTNEDGQALPGEVQYLNDGNATVLNSDGTVIASHETTSDLDDYDVIKTWDDKNGIIYRSNAGATPGSYSGKITWTLTNAP